MGDNYLYNPGSRKAAPKKVKLPDYISFEADVDPMILQDNFLDWLNDDSYMHSYDKWNLCVPGMILVRLYRYEDKSSFILDANGNPLTTYKILPFCKVIKVSEEEAVDYSVLNRFDVGDIICAPDDICDVITSVEWIRWHDKQMKERPTPETPEPVKLVGTILQWQAKYGFVNNKFNPSADDDFTFVVPQTLFKVKYIG